MRIVPLHDRIVIKEDNADEVSKGGILIPGQAQKKPSMGVVVAHGPGRYINNEFVPVTVKEGDKVLFVQNSGEVVEVDGETLRVIHDIDIIGIVA